MEAGFFLLTEPPRVPSVQSAQRFSVVGCRCTRVHGIMGMVAETRNMGHSTESTSLLLGVLLPGQSNAAVIILACTFCLLAIDRRLHLRSYVWWCAVFCS